MELRTWLKTKKITQAQFAKKFKPVLTAGAISQWLNSKIPAERVLEVVKLTKGDVTAHECRPDIYPKNLK